MYSRQPDRGIRVPPNYSGNIFRESIATPTPVEDHTRKQHQATEPDGTATYTEELSEEVRSEDNMYTQPDNSEIQKDEVDDNNRHDAKNIKEKRAPILSPFGELGTEELLLIALALIIFGSGKEPDLALILLALLFIN